MAKWKNRVDEILDELVKGRKPEEILGESGLLKELTKRLVERAIESELTDHARGDVCPPLPRSKAHCFNPCPCTRGDAKATTAQFYRIISESGQMVLREDLGELFAAAFCRAKRSLWVVVPCSGSPPGAVAFGCTCVARRPGPPEGNWVHKAS